MTAQHPKSRSRPNRPLQALPPPRTKKEIPPETRQEIVQLHDLSYGARRIARCVKESRKVVRRVLREEGCTSRPKADSHSKLDRFLDSIRERALKGLTISRILREIRELGYRGGRTILAGHVRQLRIDHAIGPEPKGVKRRFETDCGVEMQVDWSPFRVQIGGVELLVHALTVILCHCRKLFVGFFRDEQEHTLLEGLARAFEYFDGCAAKLVLDNMATAVLGRWGPNRKPIWHPAFFDFSQHYGFTPFACTEGDPDRKGKIEKPFRLVWDDFLKEKKFRTWDDLFAQCAFWLDGDKTGLTGNLRTHGTTGQIPSEAYLAERDFLIRLPRERHPVHEDELRIVDQDSTLSIGGRKYTVPTPLANRTVPVRRFAHHFEVIDPNGRVAFSRAYAGPEEPRKLLIDNTHYAGLPRRPKGSRNPERLDEAFLCRFPALAALVDGLKIKMKTLAPIHLRRLIKLAEMYGEGAFVAAATRAQSFRRFDAIAVERILAQDNPEPAGDQPGPLGGNGATALGEVDPGSLDAYGHLDEDPASTHDADDDKPARGTAGDEPDGGDPHGS